MYIVEKDRFVQLVSEWNPTHNNLLVAYNLIPLETAAKIIQDIVREEVLSVCVLCACVHLCLCLSVHVSVCVSASVFAWVSVFLCRCPTLTLRISLTPNKVNVVELDSRKHKRPPRVAVTSLDRNTPLSTDTLHLERYITKKGPDKFVFYTVE